MLGPSPWRGTGRKGRTSTFLPGPQQAREVHCGVRGADASLGYLSGFSQVLGLSGRT